MWVRWGEPEEVTRERLIFVHKPAYKQLQMNSGRDTQQLQMENRTEKGGYSIRADFMENFGKLGGSRV